MREYYTEAFYAKVLKSNINDKANAQRIHLPHTTSFRFVFLRVGRKVFFKGGYMAVHKYG